MPQVISIFSDGTILDAIQKMLKNHISSLPVADKNQNLIGIITEGDFLRREDIRTEQKRNRWLRLLLESGTLAN